MKETAALLLLFIACAPLPRVPGSSEKDAVLTRYSPG
jgi:hypothetical protein